MDEDRVRLNNALCPKCRDRESDVVAASMCKECLKKYRAFQSALHYKAHPEQRRAQRRAQYAIKTGKLTKGPCEVCGTTEDVQAHHEDHSKPLDVNWLCRSHHAVANQKRNS